MKLITIFFCLTFVTLNAQFHPTEFAVKTGNAFGKTGAVLDQTPAGNSISDLLMVGNTLWAGSSRGLSKSTDNGSTWTNYYNTTAFGSEGVSAIAYDKWNDIIFAATAHSVKKDGASLPEGSGIKFSRDGGATWIAVNQPLDDATDTVEVYGNNRLRALPVTVKIQNIIYDMAVTKNTLWIASFAGGLRKIRIDSLLSNTAKKWTRVVLPPDRLSSIKPTDTLNFCMQPVAGKFCSDNNLNYRVFSLAVEKDSIVYVGTANGINKTTEGNKADATNNLTWIKFNHQNQDNPISGNFIVALHYNDFNNVLWAASWKAEDQNEFYGISWSANGGLSWSTALNGEKPHNFASSLSSSRVSVATDNGHFISGDIGFKWYNAGTVMDSRTGLTLRTNIYYSSAFGANNQYIWLGSVDGLIRNSGIGFPYGTDWKLYFATQNLTNSNDSYAYPNPFSPRTEALKIKYSTGGSRKKVNLRIFNFSMDYVRTIIQNAERGNSINQVTAGGNGDIDAVVDFWDGRDDNGSVVPNGVYFYRVEVEGMDTLYGKIVVLQ